MALTAGGLLLMTGVDSDSSWLHLLAGLMVVGAGLGLANPLATFTHLGVLPPAQGGLASGSTTPPASSGWRSASRRSARCFRATSPTAWPRAPTASARHARAVTDRIADGDVAAATRLAPAAARDSLRTTYEAAFASGSTNCS